RCARPAGGRPAPAPGPAAWLGRRPAALRGGARRADPMAGAGGCPWVAAVVPGSCLLSGSGHYKRFLGDRGGRRRVIGGGRGGGVSAVSAVSAVAAGRVEKVFLTRSRVLRNVPRSSGQTPGAGMEVSVSEYPCVYRSTSAAVCRPAHTPAPVRPLRRPSPFHGPHAYGGSHTMSASKTRSLFRCFLASLALVALGVLPAGAQTGKLTGLVTDAATGEPLSGVQITVEGTGRSVLTQENGRYFLINVPPGVYTVTAQLLGYAVVRKENVQVTIDVTRTVDFELTSEALAVEGVVVEAERVPLIETRATGASNIVTAEQIQALP